MKGVFIPDITAEMFRNGCLESIEALMAEGKIYDIEYSMWIPVKWHTITDEEREREGYPKDWACHIDNIMPYDGQRILITTKGGFVELDECYSDDGCTFALDSGYDWVDDVVAWMPLPEPYTAEGSEKE